MDAFGDWKDDLLIREAGATQDAAPRQAQTVCATERDMLHEALFESYAMHAATCRDAEAEIRRANARADRARHALLLVAVLCLAAGVAVGVIAR